MKHYIRFVFHGMAIGVANLIPGISGGTLAVILGVYERIIQSLGGLMSFSIPRIKQSLPFLIAIGIGSVSGIILFSRIIEHTLIHYEAQTLMFFFGLVLGSIPIVYRMGHIKNINVPMSVSFLSMLGLMILLFILEKTVQGSSFQMFRQFPLVIRLGIAGAIAGAAMIVPGISGSLILLAMGIYSEVILAISTFNIGLLSSIAIGAMAGIFGSASIISWLFKKHHNIAYMAVIGFLTGSLLTLWPGLNLSVDSLFSVLSAGTGCLLAYNIGNKK